MTIDSPQSLLDEFNGQLQAEIAEARQNIAKLSAQFADEPINRQVSLSDQMLRTVGIFDALRDAEFEFAEIDGRGLTNPQLAIVRKLDVLATLMCNTGHNSGRDSRQRVEGRLTALRVLANRLTDLAFDIQHIAAAQQPPGK